MYEELVDALCEIQQQEMFEVEPVTSFNVQITGSYKDYQDVIFFTLNVSQETLQWVVFRRYSWFRNLYQKLLDVGKISEDHPFPDRTWIWLSPERLLQERREGLQVFLNSLKHLSSSKYVQSFFSPVRSLVRFESTKFIICRISFSTNHSYTTGLKNQF
eukprot:TRINITY_DN5213_c0_g1_i1.p1 TRINITY_DN5213_c0_g1~~TRINITY_DN5213_c0_g1_i1.p1  ORF type:complete len:159 (-),score=19.72 TRINITY_DN5213_c0_g1_i1:419-895(-)